MRIGYLIDTYSPLGDREAVADSMEAMIEEAQLAEQAGRFYVRHGLLQHPDFPSEADVTAESLAPYLVLGTAEQCIERLQAAEAERGIDYVILCCRTEPRASRAAIPSRSSRHVARGEITRSTIRVRQRAGGW